MKRKIGEIWRLSGTRRGEKSRARQVAEMLLLLLIAGIGPNYYQLAGFWRRHITWAEMRQHYNAREYARRVDELNPEQFRWISGHKLVEKSVAAMCWKNTGAFIAYADRMGGFDADGAPLCSLADFIRFAGSDHHKRICVKGATSSGGHSILVLAREGAGKFRNMATNSVATATEIYDQLSIAKGKSYLIEKYIDQHADVARFNRTSLNTVRIWCVKKNGRARAVSALLKVGRQGGVVDNTSSGGLIAPVDIKTGVVGPLYHNSPERRCYTHHPDHGVSVQGEVVPCLEDSKRLVEMALDRLPMFSFVGADVAITPDGPLIVEINVTPFEIHAAYMDISPREALAS